MPSPLVYRLAVVLPGPRSPRWIRQSLAAIARVPGVEVRVLFTTSPADGADAGRSRLLRSYLSWDRRAFTPDRDAAEVASIEDVLPGVERVVLSSTDARYSATYLATIARHQVDLTLDFSDRSALQQSGPQPRLGTWRLQHDGMAAGAAAAAAVLAGRSTITSRLVLGDGTNRVVCQSVSAADSFSVTLALNRVLWKSAALMPRTLRSLVTFGESILSETAAAPNEEALPLSSRRLAGHIRSLVRRAARHLRDREPGPPQWVLLRARADSGDAIRLVEEVVPGPGQFWADPCVVEHEGRQFVFLEEFSRRSGRGHLAVSELDTEGRWTPPRPILERPYHLSYPLVFRHRGDWFLLPESCENGTIELYRCERFPDRWTLATVIMRDVRAVDSTVMERDGRWWLFTNLGEFDGSSMHDDLHAFWTDDLLGGAWRPHARNPIVSDVRRARCAGHFIHKDGRLIRPSQDCSRSYGWALHLNEVRLLTERDYDEVPVAILEPHWDSRIVGTHSWAQSGDDIWLDGRLRKSHFAASWTSHLPAGGRSIALRRHRAGDFDARV